MSAESFNITSAKIVTLLITGTMSGQYQWSEVIDDNHIKVCREEINESSRIEGKIFSVKVRDSFLRLFKYRNYARLMTAGGNALTTNDGAALLVRTGDSIYVLEFFDSSDYSLQLRLEQSNSIKDLYDTVIKKVFPVEDFLKDLEEDKQS